MPKTSVYMLIVVMLVISLTLILPSPVYSSPGPATYNSYPTAHVDSGITTSPLNAYDSNNASFATVNRGSSGTFDVTTFGMLPGAGAPTTVDLKMRYSADAGSDDYYQIEYDLGSGSWIILVAWTAASTSLGNYTWSSVSRRGGGAWSWFDLPNLRFRVATERNRGDDSADFYEYEAWATITYTAPDMYVDPASQTVAHPTDFSIDIRVSGVTDFYTWEFKLDYNTSYISVQGTSNVTEGAFLASGGSTFFFVLNATDTYNATHGRIWATATLLGDIVGVSGGGIIASIDFSTDAAGTANLTLTDTKMIAYDKPNTALFTISHTAVDGTVTVTGVVPEFPFGAAFEIALVGVIFYVWWRGRRKKLKGFSAGTSPPAKANRMEYCLSGKNP